MCATVEVRLVFGVVFVAIDAAAIAFRLAYKSASFSGAGGRMVGIGGQVSSHVRG